MPARKPIGAVPRAGARTRASVSMIGCQWAAQRTTTTSPKPKPANRRVIHAPRRSPAPRRSRRRRLLGGDGAWWRSWLVSAVVVTRGSSLLAGLLTRLDEERHQRGELRLRQRRPERLRHDALRIPGLNVRVRVDDRLVDERGERLVRLLRVRDELVQIRPDRPRRLCCGERVAARA